MENTQVVEEKKFNLDMLKDILKRVRHISEWKALYIENKVVINYFIFGVVTTIVSFGVFIVCRQFFFTSDSDNDTQMSNVISWIASVTAAFITNRIWVFESHAKGFKATIFEGGKFYFSRLLTLAVDLVIMQIALYTFVGGNKLLELVAKILSNTVVLILNYFLSKLMVFRKPKAE